MTTTPTGLAARIGALERGERPGRLSLAELEESMRVLVRSWELEERWPELTGNEQYELARLHDVVERDLRRERDLLLVYGDLRTAQDRMAEAMWLTEVGFDRGYGDADAIAEGLAHVASWRTRLRQT
jgi:hypothetical protein